MNQNDFNELSADRAFEVGEETTFWFVLLLLIRIFVSLFIKALEFSAKGCPLILRFNSLVQPNGALLTVTFFRFSLNSFSIVFKNSYAFSGGAKFELRW